MNQCIPKNISIRVLETTHLPLFKTNIKTNFLLRTKCLARGGVDSQLPRILE